jgi:hypothetical protein
VSPPPNSAGWNTGDVTVSLTATSAPGGAGVKNITYSATGAQPRPPVTVAGGAVRILISAEGQTTITFAATDTDGVIESPANTITVRIDRTPPELSTRFDPGSKDLLVFGHDAGSGLSSDAVAADPASPLIASAPTSVLPATWTPADDAAAASPDAGSGAAEVRTYAVSDVAGNTTVLVIKIKRPGSSGSQLKARLISIQYRKLPAVAFGPNLEEVDWHVGRDGSLATVDQKFRAASAGLWQVVDAHYNARQGHTDVIVKNPQAHPVIQTPGLDLLQMLTSSEHLSIEY